MSDPFASPEETDRFFERLSIPKGARRSFSSRWISKMGVDLYREMPDEAIDRSREEILTRAILSGVNLFQTASHEKTLGKVIQKLKGRGAKRGGLVLAVRGGTLLVEGSFEDWSGYVRSRYVDTGLIDPRDLVEERFCIHPHLLQHQIEQSLCNLRVEGLDLFLLERLEVHWTHLEETLFYEKLFESFSFLEKKVRENQIAGYGISCWQGLYWKKKALQIEKIVEIAQRAGGEDHHFQVCQAPFNLVMQEAKSKKRQFIQEEPFSLFEACQELKVSFFASSPFMQGYVLRLAPSFYESLPPQNSRALQALSFVVTQPEIVATLVGMTQMEHFEESRSILFEESLRVEP